MNKATRQSELSFKRRNSTLYQQNFQFFGLNREDDNVNGHFYES